MFLVSGHWTILRNFKLKQFVVFSSKITILREIAQFCVGPKRQSSLFERLLRDILFIFIGLGERSEPAYRDMPTNYLLDKDF